ncbi:MAG: site-2 protease family protein [Sulfuritalea sp.]|nr:site-2 protease family protein [Sulfuritalea sp.]
MENLIQTLAIYALPVLFAITLHEAAHGYVARYFGDNTAWQLGRISLNPVRHIDLLGTIIVPALILLVSKIGGGGGVLFGWAKPVPVNFGNLRRPKQDMLWVAAAGPGANLVMAIGWAFVLKLAVTMPETVYTLPMMKMADAGIDINVVLMALNLLPLPPLDGGRIVVSLLPHRAAWRFAQLERWGFPILLGLLFMGVLGKVLALPIGMIRALIAVVFQFNY